ncbi:tyrosine-type recombinase/integrase [Micromonospora sp. NPDC003816]|uniref:tyrosine-type recombinase/integrase n=1 Tax=Micromonospora sp. NPDC003816 TaxID=3364224 RepID=UPI0036B2F6EF
MASIEQRGSAYRVVWRIPGQPGKQYTTWPTSEYAEQACGIVNGHRGRITADRVYADMGVPQFVEPGDDDRPTTPTFREWAEKWLASKTRISPGTRARYQQQFRDHIFPAFGDTPIGDMTPIMIGAWINELRANGMKTGTVTRYYSALFAPLKAAADQGVIPVNPCKGTDFRRDERADDDTGEHRAVYLTPEQYEQLRAGFDTRWHTLLDALVETGVRWGEATALAKKHLVPPTKRKAARVRVWRAWKRGEGGQRYLGTTKGRAKRSLPIGRDLYTALAQLVNSEDDECLLFRRADGRELDYSEMYNDVWAPAVTRARRCAKHPPPDRGEQRPGAGGRCRGYGGTRDNGEPCGARVRPGTTRCVSHYGPARDAVSTCGCSGVLVVGEAPSWHDLRHTCAAWLFSDPRMTPLAISRRLGHATLAVTSDIYGDLMPDLEETVVDAIADARKAGKKAGGKKVAAKKAKRQS